MSVKAPAAGKPAYGQCNRFERRDTLSLSLSRPHAGGQNRPEGVEKQAIGTQMQASSVPSYILANM
jgi:hypothetical protein